jgi:hypothetical protein
VRIIFELINSESRRQVGVDLDVVPAVGQTVRFDGDYYTVTEVGFLVEATDPERNAPAYAMVFVVATT